MNEPADVQHTFSLAEVFETKRFSKLESLLDIHLNTALKSPFFKRSGDDSAPFHRRRLRCFGVFVAAGWRRSRCGVNEFD